MAGVRKTSPPVEISPPGTTTHWTTTVHTLYLNPTDFSAVVTVQYITQIPTHLGVNANGQTYGVADSIEGRPDLISALGIAPDGTQVVGYVLDSELNASSPDHPGLPSTHEEALRWQEETQEKYPRWVDHPRLHLRRHNPDRHLPGQRLSIGVTILTASINRGKVGARGAGGDSTSGNRNGRLLGVNRWRTLVR